MLGCVSSGFEGSWVYGDDGVVGWLWGVVVRGSAAGLAVLQPACGNRAVLYMLS